MVEAKNAGCPKCGSLELREEAVVVKVEIAVVMVILPVTVLVCQICGQSIVPVNVEVGRQEKKLIVVPGLKVVPS